VRRFIVAIALLIPLTAVPARAAVPEGPCPAKPAAGVGQKADVEQARRVQLVKMQEPPRATARDYFSSLEIKKARDYKAFSNLINFIWLAVGVLTLLVLGYFRARRLGEWAQRRTNNKPYRTATLLTAVMVIAPFLLGLPLRICDHEIDRHAGLATDSNAEFAADVAKGLGIRFAMALVAALLFLWVARKLPRGWPLVVATGAAALTFLLVYVFPVVYEPVFNTFTPVGPRTERIVQDIASKQNVDINDVLVADASRRTSTLNAYVSGVGSTKRVVLYDNLLDEPCDVFRIVVAHEIAHDRHRDVLNGTFLSMAGVAFGVFVLEWLLRRKGVRNRTGIEQAGDPKAVPFLILFIALANFFAMPLVNGISRMVEERADKTAIEVTDSPEAAIRTEQRIAKTNLSDLDPNPFIRWWFFTHPSTLERIQIALDYEWARARCPNGKASATCPPR
jgi:STE24 endopeptidase